VTNTSLPGPVPGIHVFEANSLKGQSSICLTGFDPKQILGINSTVFASCPKAAVMTGEVSRLCRQHPQTGHPLRLYGIEEHIKRRDLSIANDDHIQARVVGRLVARPRSPSQTTGIVQGLGLAVRGVNEVRVGRAEIASKFVEGFEADEYAGRHIQHAVFGIEVLNRCSAARRITLAEDFLQVAVKQFADMVGDRLSP